VAEKSARRKLYLIDGFHTIFRAFYAIRELTNSKGEPTNAVYGFVQILRKILRDERPDYVGVAWDVADETTLRREKFADYKAQRAPMPDALVPQIPQIQQAIEAFRIPRIELEGHEADDVMGTLAKRAAAAGLEVVLVTADKDMLQLVGDGVSLLHTGRNKLYDARLVEEDFGVPPERVADVLALVGDAVDNVPGVPGIGEKGARQLVQEYGSVEALLERAAEIPRKAYREGLLQHRAQALLSKELTTIRTDLPIELRLDQLAVEPPDADALRRLYAELEFRTLLEELGGTGATAPRRDLVEAESAEEAARLLAALGGRVTAVLVPGEEPVALALAGGGETIAFLDLRRSGLGEAARSALARLAGSAAGELVGHDLKELLRLLPRGAGIDCARFDTLLASYLLRTSSHGHPFEELCFEKLGVQPRSAKECGFDRGQVPPVGDERLRAFAAERIELADRLEPMLRSELEATSAGRVYREIEAPLTPVLLAMEETGIALDVDYLARMSAEMSSEMAALEGEIHDLAGERFNIQSPQQLGTVLFEKLGLKAKRRTQKTKSWSTDADTLAELAAEGHPLPERLLRYRELAKLKGTYVDALPAMVGPDGRIHTRFMQAVAATGRISSWNPNLQNIPVRTEQGEKIRHAFRAADGMLLVCADYSQIELRILAHIAEEPALIAAFRRGDDIHRATMAELLGVDPALVTAEQRRAAKAVNFGLIYGQGAYGLSQSLGIPVKEAERFIERYFERYAGVKRYMEETLARAEAEGRVETLWGRPRLLPELAHPNRAVRENARRVAINSRIQGSAADLLKLAMIALDRRLVAACPGARLLLTVHDELVLEAPAGEAERVAGLVRAEMEGAARLAVPLVVETGIGPNWGEAKG
jgi:DNA polymerase-1